MIPVMDRRRDVLAPLSLISAARGLGCAQTELGKKATTECLLSYVSYLL
jgi:hypothetical protein